MSIHCGIVGAKPINNPPKQEDCILRHNDMKLTNEELIDKYFNNEFIITDINNRDKFLELLIYCRDNKINTETIKKVLDFLSGSIV